MANDRRKKIMMSEKQLEKLKLAHIRQAADLYQMIALWALHNSEGFGEKRLARVLEAMDVVAEDIMARRLSTDDIRQTLEEETGLRFTLHE